MRSIQEIDSLTRKILSKILGQECPNEANFRFLDLHQWDSFKTVELILEVESTFNFEMSSLQIDSLKNFSDLISVIAELPDA